MHITKDAEDARDMSSDLTVLSGVLGDRIGVLGDKTSRLLGVLGDRSGGLSTSIDLADCKVGLIEVVGVQVCVVFTYNYI